MDFTNIFSSEDKFDFGLILSFDLDAANFFEGEILNKIKINQNLTLVMDDMRYKRLITSSDFNPNYLGINYNLEKVKVRNGGQFHPKIYLFLSNEAMHLAIGSANLTFSGFKRNVECLVFLKFKSSNLDAEEIDFILQLRDFLEKCFVRNNSLIEPVSNTLKEHVGNIINSSFFKVVNEQNKDGRFSQKDRKFYLLSSIDDSLFNQIRRIAGSSFEKVQVLSPFYDDDATAFQSVSKLADKVDVYIPRKNNTFPKEAVDKDAKLKKKCSFFLVDKKENDYDRFIHAKYYRFSSTNKNWDFITSANFSNSGMFNDSFPRNFETGVLVLARKGGFLDASDMALERIKDFNSIFPVKRELGEETFTHECFFLESALYDGKKIYIHFAENFLVEHDMDDFKIELKIGNTPEDKYTVRKENRIFFIEPSLEIEGDKTIQIKLVSIKIGQFTSNSIYVNRDKHIPNYLPSLGASAYNECVRIGGVDGLKRAFQYASSSGRSDWLMFLLSHWNLEKILQGINKETIPEGQGLEDNIIPTLPVKAHSEPGEAVIKRNLDTVLTNTELDLKENLEAFLVEIWGINDSWYDRLKNYIDFCFPLFFQIARYYKEILQREEKRKELQPGIEYPEYTWLLNYNKYDEYLYIILSEIKRFLSIAQKCKKEEQQLLFHFLALSLVWFLLHTEKTLAEFFKRNKNLNELKKEIEKAIADLYIDIDSKLISDISNLFENYSLSPQVITNLNPFIP